MQWYIAALKKYAQFSGRARRREYWMFTLFYILGPLPIAVVWYAVYLLNFQLDISFAYFPPVFAVLLALTYWLALLIPGLAVSVRRLHDTDRSGAWLLLDLTGIGSVVLLVFLAQEGTGDNRYGPDPKATYAGMPETPPGWFPDPTGRHESRFWDSRRWTNQVADSGATSTDSVVPQGMHPGTALSADTRRTCASS